MNRSINYVSIDVIANKIYKNPLLKDINFEDIIDFTLGVVRIANVPGVYKHDHCYKDIVDHKVYLPKFALNLKTVDYCDGNNLIPMNSSSYSLSNSVDKIKENKKDNAFTYSVDNGILKTSCRTGKVFITFDTIKLDENDIPMIPDSEAFLRAVEAYIKVQVYTVLADLGKLSERSLDRAEKEYYFNIGKAQTEFQGFLNEDDMNSFINGQNRQFLSQNDHNNRYADRSSNERLNRL